MPFEGARVTVDTSADVIADADVSETQIVTNRSSTVVYLGGSGVTSATGYQLSENESIMVQLRRNEQLYAITASGSATVHVLRH